MTAKGIRAETVERLARAMNPRAWQAFDGYSEVFIPKDWPREERWNGFIYGSPRDPKGHDWGVTLQVTIEHALAALAFISDMPAIAAAARQGGDVKQAPGETPQSGAESASPERTNP